jgi:DNA-binding response OmpR family regulator
MKAVIERYMALPQHEGGPANVLSHRDIFMSVDYHKVFVRGHEIHLSKHETMALGLLLTQAGCVFGHGQIYNHVYGEDAPPDIMANSVYSQIKRIRRKLRAEPGDCCDYIDSVRGVGYRITAS